MNENSTSERRKALTEITVKECAEVQRLCLELANIRNSSDPFNADRLRNLLIVAAQSMMVSEMPRGYRVLGGTAKTPYYIQRNGARATDSNIVTDVLTGLLDEIASKQQATLDRLKPKPTLPQLPPK